MNVEWGIVVGLGHLWSTGPKESRVNEYFIGTRHGISS